MSVLSDRLRVARLAKGMTIVQCADAIGVTNPAWNQWETGKREPKFDKLLDICQLLDTTPNDLLGVSQGSASAKATADKSGAVAKAVSWRDFVPSAVAGAPGELPQCARCEHRKLAERMRKMLAGK